LLIFCEVEFVPYDIKCENDVVNYSSGATSQLSLKMFKEGILTDCVIEACVHFLSANKQSFLVSKEWKQFKSLNKNFAFRLLESSALIEERQIERKQVVNDYVCSNCEQRCYSSPRFTP
uniref:Uncharacterized protein n=1 Tax=Meloidogyne floridensis TaxID=298350 RepID=A0A915NUJ2_9BILA